MVVPATNLAVIESACIGCMLCVPVCPTDAIEGEAKQLHKVIDADCTGCGLCVPVCPVDAITMVAQHAGINTLQKPTLPQSLKDKIEAARANARLRHKHD